MTIPNDGDTAYFDTEFQSRPVQADWDILFAGVGGANGVVSGCGVSESGPPAMSVDVTSGTIASNSVSVSVRGDTVLVPDADTTDPRFDLIVALDDGSVDIVTGIADPSPVMPSPPSGSVALAQVFVPANNIAVANNQIVQKKVPVPAPNPTNLGWNTISPNTDLARTNTAALAADPTLKFAMAASTKYRIRGQVWFLHSAGSGSQVVKFGIGGPASPTLLLGRLDFLQSSIQSGAFGNSHTPQGGDFMAYNTTTGLAGLTASYLTLSAAGWATCLGFECIVHNGANAADFALYWSQTTATSAATISRLAGSYLEYSTVV